MIYLISECETPNEAWAKLEKHFERDTLSNKIFLKKKFFRSEMNEDESISTHIKKMKEITDSLAAIKAPISEEDQAITLLGSLPSKYDSLVIVLEAKAELKLDEIKQALINEEQKRKPSITCTSNYTSDRALYVKAERVCFVCGGSGHYKAECPNNSKIYSIFRHDSWRSIVLHLSVCVCFYAAIHVVLVTVYCGLLY